VNTPVTPIPGLTLGKNATSSRYNSVGSVIDYIYHLQNTGNVALSGPFSVNDDLVSVTCPQPASLAPDAFIDCTGSYTVTQADLDTGSISNSATGHATFGIGDVASNGDHVTVYATQIKRLTLSKNVTSSPASFVLAGDVLTYSYVLRNDGNVTLDGPFTASDDKTSVWCPPTSTLSPNMSIECTSSYSVTQADVDAGFVTNTATGHASFNGSPVYSNQDSVRVDSTAPVGSNLMENHHQVLAFLPFFKLSLVA
jgi:hypothetical protein